MKTAQAILGSSGHKTPYSMYCGDSNKSTYVCVLIRQTAIDKCANYIAKYIQLNTNHPSLNSIPFISWYLMLHCIGY